MIAVMVCSYFLDEVLVFIVFLTLVMDIDFDTPRTQVAKKCRIVAVGVSWNSWCDTLLCTGEPGEAGTVCSVSNTFHISSSLSFKMPKVTGDLWLREM